MFESMLIRHIRYSRIKQYSVHQVNKIITNWKYLINLQNASQFIYSYTSLTLNEKSSWSSTARNQKNLKTIQLNPAQETFNKRHTITTAISTTMNLMDNLFAYISVHSSSRNAYNDNETLIMYSTSTDNCECVAECVDDRTETEWKLLQLP